MKRPKTGSTPKQYAYAVRKLNGEGRSNKENALIVGFSLPVANNVKNKIENTEGYQNAIIGLAHESNNMVLAAMAEYKARGFKNFSNKDLNGAMNALAAAWDRINKTRAPNGSKQPENRLKTIVMQKIENQNVTNVTATPITKEEEPEVDLDF